MFCEFHVVGEAEIRDIRHHVICTLRKITLEPGVPKHRNDEIAFALVFLLKLFVIARRQRHRVRTGVLERVGRTDGEEVMNLSDRGSNVGRGGAVADSPTRHRVGFR